MLVSLDIETTGKEAWHSLDHNRQEITVIGAYWIDANQQPCTKVMRSVDELNEFIKQTPGIKFVGHNFKFDFKGLVAKGAHITYDMWADDTMLMAVASHKKVPKLWLEKYEKQRLHVNKSVKKGYSHRKAGRYSLKTLAPYFLNVSAFWETPEDHNNDEYVLKDCEYTYRLYSHFNRQLKAEGTYEFYKKKLLEWTKLLTKAEMRGIRLDLDRTNQEWERAIKDRDAAKARLDSLWSDVIVEHSREQVKKIKADYKEKLEAAIDRLKDKSKAETTRLRYKALEAKALEKIEPLNYDSPSQLMMVLRDKLNLNVRRLDNDEESTGKSVLEKLASQGREDIKELLNYRKAGKLASAFFPTWTKLQYNGNIHPTFNPSGARTGRLSCSNPNLQQVPGSLHGLLVARPGYKLATFDMSAIEPRIIAFLTQDPILLDLTNNNKDLHGHNAKVFFNLDCDVSEVKEKYPEERKIAKTVGLALFYGAGAKRIQFAAMQNGLQWSTEECQQKLERFKAEYETAFNFKRKVFDPLLDKGEPVENIFGRPVYIESREDVYMTGFNTMVQGSASDLVLDAAYKIQAYFERYKTGGHVLLLVHDEIVAEIPKNELDQCVGIIKHCMTNYNLTTGKSCVKLEVEGKVEDSWQK